MAPQPGFLSRRDRLLAPIMVIAASPPAAGVIALPLDELDDAAMVRRARSGDTWAHEAIYRRYVRSRSMDTNKTRLGQMAWSMAACLLMFGTPLDQTWAAGPPGNAISLVNISQTTEFYATGVPQIAVSRVHRRFRWRRLVGWCSAGADASLEQQASSDATPEQRAELALIDRALQRLSLKVRTPWILRHVLGEPLDDVALACGCSLATVKRRIGEAEARVRRHVTGDSRVRGAR